MGLRADLKLVLEERLHAVLDVVKLHWSYYRYRAHTWRIEKNISELRRTDPKAARDWWEESQIEFEIYEHLRTQRLKRLADRYHMQMPVGDEYYDAPTGDVRRSLEYMTPAGKAAFQQTLFDIRKERRAAAAFWVASIVGILGALTGLLSVILKS